jgi:serine protease inhibitor
MIQPSAEAQEAHRAVINAHGDAVDAAEATEKARHALARAEQKQREADRAFLKALESLTRLVSGGSE